MSNSQVFIDDNKAEDKKFEPIKFINTAPAGKLLGKKLHGIGVIF